jgi:hypothetical protein
MKLNLLLLSAAALFNAATAVETVPLGAAGNYAILAQSGISTVPTSAITGDIAVSPSNAATITGFGLIADAAGQFSTASQVTGIVHAADYISPTPATLTDAVGDMGAAYENAAGRDIDVDKVDLGAGILDDLTFGPGVYTYSTDIGIHGAKQLTFTGSSTDIFIIRVKGNVNLAVNTKVVLAGGAKAENIFWQVTEQVTVGAGAHMEGIILSKTAVTFITGSSLNGRILTQMACVLQMATITQPPATRRLRGVGA